MTLGQWMTIWLAVLLVVVLSAHRLLLQRLRRSAGYQALVTGRPERDRGGIRRGSASAAAEDLMEGRGGRDKDGAGES